MRRIAATLAVVGALLFSAGSAWAEGTNDISDWLESIGLEKFEDEFLSNDITPDILPDLTNADLKEMGINSLGARKRILKAIKEGPAPVATDTPRAAKIKQTYCKRDDGSVVAVDQLNLDIPCDPHTEISQAVYDRLAGGVDHVTAAAASSEEASKPADFDIGMTAYERRDYAPPYESGDRLPSGVMQRPRTASA